MPGRARHDRVGCLADMGKAHVVGRVAPAGRACASQAGVAACRATAQKGIHFALWVIFIYPTLTPAR